MDDRDLNPRTRRSKVSPEEMAGLAQQMSQAPAGGTVVERTGGARLGWMNFSFPLASLRADAWALTIKAPFGTHRLELAEVVALREYKGWFSRGVKIEHKRKGSPERLIFWPMSDVKGLLGELSALGYPVA